MFRVEVSELKAAEGKREEEIKVLKEEKSKLEGRITSLTGELATTFNIYIYLITTNAVI